MRVRITDALRGEFFLDLEVDDEGDEPEVDEDQAEALLNWWAGGSSPRDYEILEDGGIIVLADSNEDGMPSIYVWYQETSDTTWPLSGFPHTGFSYEEVAS